MVLRFVTRPNLPINAVKTVLLGDKYTILLSKLLEMQGISVISMPENPDIAPQTASHADMSLCHLGQNRVIVAKSVYEKLKPLLPNGLQLLEAGKPQIGKYPDDIGLNACIIGDRLLHNLKHSDPIITLNANLFGLKSFNVKQGYTKCSICVLNQDRIITSDRGIHDLSERLGIKSLLIKSGSIMLEGYDTGFIGGSCGKLSENKIAFTGRFDRHPDATKITNFIEEANIEIIYLTDGPVFDVGSIIPLQESAD